MRILTILALEAALLAAALASDPMPPPVAIDRADTLEIKGLLKDAEIAKLRLDAAEVAYKTSKPTYETELQRINAAFDALRIRVCSAASIPAAQCDLSPNDKGEWAAKRKAAGPMPEIPGKTSATDPAATAAPTTTKDK